MPSSPGRPNLEQLRKQARELLHGVGAGDSRAQRRVAAHAPQFIGTPRQRRRDFLLADALLVVAREHGFVSWPRLKAYAERRLQAGSSVPQAASGPSRPQSRKEFAQALAIEIAALAREHQIEALAQLLGRTPRWAGLIVRELVVASDDYPALVDALLEGIRHPNANIRYICAHALDGFGDDRCAEPLRRLLDDPAPRVRRVALHSLGCQDCKLMPLQTAIDFPALAVEQALNDPSINVRRAATATLGICGADPRATLALNTLLANETDTAIRRNARFALRRIGGPANSC